LCVAVAIIGLVFFQLVTWIAYAVLELSDSDSSSSSSSSSNSGHYFWSHYWGGGGGQTIKYHDDQPVLIVGGTDGSGTRAFVDALRQLGVLVVADDPDTFDVHGNEMFHHEGWPALINRILEQTHSGNYIYEDLPTTTKTILSREVMALKESLENKYRRDKQRRKYFHRRDGTIIPPATKVSFAMKAPVAMMALPVMAHVFAPRQIKFLHVLRE
jgi:hypothetical protein